MSMKLQLLDMEIQIHFSLLQPLCQISKKLYGKSKPCNNLRTALRKQIEISAMLESKEIRNNIINIHLPLMMFIRMHSQESQFHNKRLICSIKFIYVQIPPFVSAFGKQIQTHDMCASPVESTDEKSKKLYYRSQKHVKRSIESIFRMFLR